MHKNILIYETQSVKEALKLLDKTAEKVLLVIDENNILLGTITDGDIRRHILQGKGLELSIKGAYNKSPHYLKKESFSAAKAKSILIRHKIDLLPIVDSDNKPIDYVTWSQVFCGGRKKVTKNRRIKIPAVIMAGGKGSRLEPFTRIIPKPLMPIGDKAMIEVIIDEFKKHGISEFYVTLNVKGEMIQSYFSNIQKDYLIKYVWEKNKFLGTAGSLKLLEKKIGDIFIVSNCDIIVKADFKEVIDFHRQSKSWLTIMSSAQHYKIPYGVIEYKEGGVVLGINEKPEYTFLINGGVYVLNRDVLRYIPKNSSFHMTDLIRTLIKNNKKVVIYPVNEGDYIDIGQWEEYKKAIEKIKDFEV